MCPMTTELEAGVKDETEALVEHEDAQPPASDEGFLERAELWGRVFEIAAKRGVLGSLRAHKLLDAHHPALAAWRELRLSRVDTTRHHYHNRLGKHEAAQQTLALLRLIAKEPHWVDDAESQAFVQEAEKLLQGPPARPGK